MISWDLFSVTNHVIMILATETLGLAQRSAGELCQTMVEKSADVNGMRMGGATALYKAVERNDRTMIELLLNYEANLDKKSWAIESALSFALGKVDMVSSTVMEKGKGVD
ncbi:hypothetical protein BJ878DRAFT_326318 [Calycina marina]|uniref:Uncharacterized protein n=1 Tax=Calycina marina TaxID=1763456 RepID=A0A9P8CJ91_9HELO|nr:hypothetical protein BJ878DRAFT_326318 [Calycina marina]